MQTYPIMVCYAYQYMVAVYCIDYVYTYLDMSILHVQMISEMTNMVAMYYIPLA